MKNIKGFRLNKNGKPILSEQCEIMHDNYKGLSYKENGVYYFLIRTMGGKYIYKP